MKILVVPDKFKHTLTSEEVANIITLEINKKYPYFHIISFPAADGGEGTSEIIASTLNTDKITLNTFNPVFDRIHSSFYFSEKTKTAYIDLSASSGLQLLKKESRNPLYTSTYGTGELISRAVKKGAETIYLALGGSATNDAACGAAEAVGYKLYDYKGNEISNITGKDLIKISKIDNSSVKFDFNKIKVIALYDVNNPLYGNKGAAYVYAGQKGANKEEIKLLDTGLNHFAKIVQSQFGINVSNCEGCGAAGGFGAGSKVFFNAELKPGAETVLQLSRFYEIIKDVDLIITGEGKFDKQSFNGKLTGTIINKAEKNNIPVIVICGINDIKKTILEKYKKLKIFALYETFPGEKQAKKESSEKINQLIANSDILNRLIQNK